MWVYINIKTPLPRVKTKIQLCLVETQSRKIIMCTKDGDFFSYHNSTKL